MAKKSKKAAKSPGRIKVVSDEPETGSEWPALETLIQAV